MAALINLPPGSEITLDVPADEAMAVPAWTMALARMEEIAFTNNPDLGEQGYLARIAVDETRKASSSGLPGITCPATRQGQQQLPGRRQWYEAGAKMSWNLMNLVSGPGDRPRRGRRGRRQVPPPGGAHGGAGAGAHVLAPVPQRHQPVRPADELWKVDKRLCELSEARAANDASGILERVAGRASAIASQLRRFQTYAQVEQAYAKVQATLGQDLLPDTVATTDLHGLSQVIAARMAVWDHGSVAALPDPAPMPVTPQVAAPAGAPEPHAAAEAPPTTVAAAGSERDPMIRAVRWMASASGLPLRRQPAHRRLPHR